MIEHDLEIQETLYVFKNPSASYKLLGVAMIPLTGLICDTRLAPPNPRKGEPYTLGV